MKVTKQQLAALIADIKSEVENGSYHTIAIRTLPLVKEAVDTIHRGHTKTYAEKETAFQYLADSIRKEMHQCWQSGKGYGSGNMFLATVEWLEYNELNGEEEDFQNFPYYGSSELATDFVDMFLKEVPQDPDEVLTVYRGGELDGWSWTTNPEVASRFAGYNKTPMYTMQIKASDVVCKIGDDRNESEVIINPCVLEEYNPVKIAG
ncbi:TPA: hypothetical protein PX772_002841 [Vibrio cholerae]|nr:hypothetical protein [Vibrio cholerae]